MESKGLEEKPRTPQFLLEIFLNETLVLILFTKKNIPRLGKLLINTNNLLYNIFYIFKKSFYLATGEVFCL